MLKLATDAPFGHGKRVERLQLPALRVVKNLRDFGDGDAVVDRDVDVVLFDLENAAEPAIGDQQPSGVRIRWLKQAPAGDRRREQS